MMIRKRPAKSIDVMRRTKQRTYGIDTYNLQVVDTVAHQLLIAHGQAVQGDNARVAAYIRQRLVVLMRYRYGLVFVPEVPLLPLSGPAITFATMPPAMEAICNTYFRFDKPQLQRVYTALQVPNNFRTESGHRVHGETAFLTTVMRLASGDVLAKMQILVNLQHTVISRVVNSFCLWLVRSWGYLILDNLAFFAHRLPGYAAAIEAKIAAKYNHFFPVGFRIALFIDCCIMLLARPGGGPKACA